MTTGHEGGCLVLFEENMEAQNKELEGRVVSVLKSRKIKLWLSPYDSDDELEMLSGRLSETMGEKVDTQLLRDLRQHALSKLAAKRRLVNIRVRDVVASFDCATLGRDVRAALAAACGMEQDRCSAVIARGRRLRDEQSLEAQGWVSSGSTPLRALLSIRSTEDEMSRLANAAERVAGDFDLSSVQGSAFWIDSETKKHLVVGLLLAAKGRSLLEEEDEAERALCHLVKADQAFCRCPEALSRRVENIGLLQLDICRAYALLGDPTAVDDAEHRLAQAEAALSRRLDANFVEISIAAAKTGRKVPPQLVPVMRLRLLRGVAIAARGGNGSRDLEDASALAAALQVDEEHLEQLLLLGASSRAEAVAALRRAEGDLQKAASSIVEGASQKTSTRKAAAVVDAKALDRLRELMPQADLEQLVSALMRNHNDLQKAFLDQTSNQSPSTQQQQQQQPQQTQGSGDEDEYRRARDIVQKELLGSVDDEDASSYAVDGCSLDLERLLLGRWAAGVGLF